MANRIITRSGASAPSSSNLLDKELGYSTNNQTLYIRDGNNIVPLAGTALNPAQFVFSTTAPSKTVNILWIDITDGMYIPKVYHNNAWHPLGAVFS